MAYESFSGFLPAKLKWVSLILLTGIALVTVCLTLFDWQVIQSARQDIKAGPDSKQSSVAAQPSVLTPAERQPDLAELPSESTIPNASSSANVAQAPASPVVPTTVVSPIPVASPVATPEQVSKKIVCDYSHTSKPVIKGVIDALGIKIYLVPGDQWYLVTKLIPGKGGHWFCTEDEAEAAGWKRGN